MNEYGVVLFYTTSAAIRSESVLQKAGYKVRLIPVPREFSSDCGLALRFFWGEAQAVQDALAAARVEMAGVYEILQGPS